MAVQLQGSGCAYSMFDVANRQKVPALPVQRRLIFGPGRRLDWRGLLYSVCLCTLSLEWRNWQTHGTQNPAFFTEHVGSTPTSSTK